MDTDYIHLLTQTPQGAYLLGYLWADGSLLHNRVSLEITKTDFDEIIPLLRSLSITKFTERQRYKNNIKFGKPVGCCAINNKQLADFLRMNHFDRKSGASFSTILSALPRDLVHYWWRGYMDGDGSLCTAKTKCLAFWSVWNQDWVCVINLYNHLKINYHIYQYSRKNNTHKSSVIETRSIPSIIKFCQYIYQGDISFGLKRKYNRFLSLSTWTPKRKEKTSKFIGVQKTRSGKFRTSIQYKFNGRNILYTKTFTNELSAAIHYNEFITLNKLNKRLNIVEKNDSLIQSYSSS